MDREGFADWFEAYREAWERKDPAAAGDLFVADAEYRRTPFDAIEGREAIERYWERVTAAQHDLSVAVEPLAFDGVGVGRFVAEYADDDGADVTIDGVCVVAFEGDRAARFREWWHRG